MFFLVSNKEYCGSSITSSKLKTSLKEEYGIIHDDCVMKITGQADRPGELTDRFRNENYPNIA